MLEVVLNWTVQSGAPAKSIIYFRGDVAIAGVRTALNTYLTAIRPILSTGTTATVPTEGRVIEAATGTLTGMWAAGTPLAVSGSSAARQVPNAAQALQRLNTGVVVNGRMVKGRIFIPGVGDDATSSGELTTTAIATMTTAGNALAAASGLVVWHRPNVLGAGQDVLVQSTSAWRELAVLRRRR